MNENNNDSPAKPILSEELQRRENAINWALAFVSKLRRTTEQCYDTAVNAEQRERFGSMKSSLVIFELIISKLVEENDIVVNLINMSQQVDNSKDWLKH